VNVLRCTKAVEENREVKQEAAYTVVYSCIPEVTTQQDKVFEV
jgi:hypothetical protein